MYIVLINYKKPRGQHWTIKDFLYEQLVFAV